MKPARLIVVGTLAANPYAGMAWMTMQITAGLRRLGHDVYYFETSSDWPYDPDRNSKVCDSEFAVPYLSRVAGGFGLDGRWAYRRSYLDRAWLGMDANRAESLLAEADAVFNVTGATQFAEDGLKVGRLVYLGTDPVWHEVTLAEGAGITASIVAEHDDVVTYGENIGTPASPIPPLPKLRAHMRQPVLMDMWDGRPPTRSEFTTIGNWEQEGRDVVFKGETYFWSKHREFQKFLDVPARSGQVVELATNLAAPDSFNYGDGAEVRTQGMSVATQTQLHDNGWALLESRHFTRDPWQYRDYVCGSRAEFTVARDLNVRLRSGWFSERSACYLAAGRPVVTQNTGFGTVLPTGEGLFAFDTTEEAVEAINEINGDYPRHAKAAKAIAEEYFRAETVLSKMLGALNL
ncbi:MAG TPA: hypothetical protein VMZ90_06675 [Vicinamibacterales bacterium]|nr:hypothetical protein [Vicinamibacterales bacterium]